MGLRCVLSSQTKVKTLEAILKRPIGIEGVQKKPKKKRKASVAEIFLSDDQRAAAASGQHEDEIRDAPPPTTSKRMESTMDLLENPPMSPSEGMLKPISDAIGILMKQNAKMADQQGELLRRMAVLEAGQGDDIM